MMTRTRIFDDMMTRTRIFVPASTEACVSTPVTTEATANGYAKNGCGSAQNEEGGPKVMKMDCRTSQEIVAGPEEKMTTNNPTPNVSMCATALCVSRPVTTGASAVKTATHTLQRVLYYRSLGTLLVQSVFHIPPSMTLGDFKIQWAPSDNGLGLHFNGRILAPAYSGVLPPSMLSGIPEERHGGCVVEWVTKDRVWGNPEEAAEWMLMDEDGEYSWDKEDEEEEEEEDEEEEDEEDEDEEDPSEECDECVHYKKKYGGDWKNVECDCDKEREAREWEEALKALGSVETSVLEKMFQLARYQAYSMECADGDFGEAFRRAKENDFIPKAMKKVFSEDE